MQIANKKVVSITYVLKDDSGNTIEAVPDGENFEYLHGYQNIIPGLENALAGKQQGDELTVNVSPEEGYGPYDDTMVQTVDRKMFGDSEVIVGAQYFADSPDGDQIAVTVTKVDDNTVTVDGNPPLAGQNLCFDVKILEVRDATDEEMEHGHVHAADGHHHG